MNVKRLWKKGSLDHLIKAMNSAQRGLGDTILEILNEAEDRHKVQMLELMIMTQECISKPMGVEPHSWSDYKSSN